MGGWVLNRFVIPVSLRGSHSTTNVITPWGIFNSPVHEVEQSVLYLGDINAGIIAGAVGTLIEDTEDRDGVGISDTARQIEFTGNGNNGLRLHFDDNSPGQRPSRGDGDFDLVTLGKLKELLDLAFAAPLAVLNVARDLNVTIEILDALGQQEEQPGGLRLMGI